MSSDWKTGRPANYNQLSSIQRRACDLALKQAAGVRPADTRNPAERHAHLTHLVRENDRITESKRHPH